MEEAWEAVQEQQLAREQEAAHVRPEPLVQRAAEVGDEWQ